MEDIEGGKTKQRVAAWRHSSPTRTVTSRTGSNVYVHK